MKKLLGIVVLGLLWCNTSQAKVFELNNCYVKSYSDWKKYSKATLLKDLIYSVDTTNKKITRLYIIDDVEKYYERKIKDWNKARKVAQETGDEKYFIDTIPKPTKKKYIKKYWKLTDITAGIATSEEEDSSFIHTININLDTGEIESLLVSKPYAIMETQDFVQCKKKNYK